MAKTRVFLEQIKNSLTPGSIIIFDSGNTAQYLTPGLQGEVLTIGLGGLPEYTTISGGTGISGEFLTGATFNNSNFIFTNTTNSGNTIDNDLTILASDRVVTGGTYDGGTGVITYTTNSGNTFEVTGFVTGGTDNFVTGGTYDSNSGEITFNDVSNVGFVVTGITSGGGNDLYTGATPSTISVGGVPSGYVLTGKTYTEIFQQMLVVYQSPTASTPVVSPYSSTVEVGVTLSGNKTFTWSTTNSSNVQPNSMVIRDVTGGVDLATGLGSSGSQLTGTTTIQLVNNNDTQQWRMEGVNTNLVAFNSGNRTVTAKFYRFYGPNSTSPTDSATVRALPTSAFQTANSNTFSLNTGNVETKFIVALPPSRTIVNVIDVDALNANITSQYINTGTISVLDDGGTGSSQTYNIYEMNVGAAYATSHNHEITTA